MVIFLIAVAVASGGVTVFLLWQQSVLLAIIVAPLVASLSVALAAAALARRYTRGGIASDKPQTAMRRVFDRLRPR
jgi:hypothetical protein